MRSRFPAFLTLFVFVIVSAHAGEYVNEGDEVYDASGGTEIAGTFNDGYDNRGTVTAIGGSGGATPGSGSGMYVSNGFTNSGTVTATGNGAGSTFTGVCSGIYVDGSNGFTNTGMVTATGGAGSNGFGSGSGIYVVSGGFKNSGTVTATGNEIYSSAGLGIGSASGIYIEFDGFTNNGTVIATGGWGVGGQGNTSGIYINSGGFINYGTVTAAGGIGDGEMASGIYVYSGGFTNNGTLTLARAGNNYSAAVFLSGLTADNNLILQANSTLELAGGYIDMHTAGSANSVSIVDDGKPQLVSLSASALGVGEDLTHDRFIRNGDSSSTQLGRRFYRAGSGR